MQNSSSDYLVSIHKELAQDAQSGMIFADTILDTKRSIYYGSLECHYMRHYPDTMVPVDFMLHFSDGYMQWTKDSLGDEQLSLYYYYQDHLGNVCAVWNATEDTIIQQTCYYASGLPMNVSSGMSAQPYLYNGKEYVEAHGYDIFDYGFRGYYAATGQFTSIDPLCERTPWQSPYVYANNNPICNIDWMGLSATSMSWKNHTYSWVALDHAGNVISWGNDNGDYHVYLVDDDWDHSYNSLREDQIIGWELTTNGNYTIGSPCYYLASTTKVVGLTVYGGQCLMYGKQVVSGSVDSTIEAVWKYFTGFYEDQALGDMTMRAFLSHLDVIKLINDIHHDSRDFIPSSNIPIDMTKVVFHIGKTTVQYYATSSYIIVLGGVGDEFSDPDILHEKLGKYIPIFQSWQSDHSGPHLEILWGMPYKYIPCAIIIPR